jgi:hypothetical protein
LLKKYSTLFDIKMCLDISVMIMILSIQIT